MAEPSREASLAAPLPLGSAVLGGLAGGFVAGVTDAAIALLIGGRELADTAEGVAVAAGAAALGWAALAWCAVLAWLVVAAVATVARGWWSRSAVAVALGTILAGSAGVWLAVGLTDGRRLRVMPLRPLLIGGAALAAVALAFAASRLCLRLLRTNDERPRALGAGVASLGGAAAMAADALFLPRLYPHFHVGAALAGVGLFLVAGVLATPATRTTSRGPWLALTLATLAAVIGWEALAARPNARLVVLDHAPLGGKLTALVARRPAEPEASASPGPGLDPAAPGAVPAGTASDAGPGGPGLDLRNADVLVITVDALRADVVGPRGRQPSVTPALDRLAQGGVTFDRAYCATPHTSYSLASFWSSTYLRSLAAIDSLHGHVQLAARPTGASLARQAGYRTAAFFPPPVFFVDGARFAAIERDAFGFEEVRRGYASAAERVRQLRAWLERAPRSQPALVWIHLFEPHEPYEPSSPPADDTPFGRYLGEVADVDRAIGEIVQAFRTARPRSVVVITADHGEEFGEHGGRFHGTTVHDEQVRVPLLVLAPGLAPRRVSPPVETLDVVTTLLPMLGIAPDPRMRGDDLGGWLAGRASAEPPSPAFVEIGDARAVIATLRGRTWKLACDLRIEEGCRLFDLDADAAERHNVADARPEVVHALRRRLESWAGSHASAEREATDAWPPGLVRAATGDARAAPLLVPLLGSERAHVRAVAARLLGDLDHRDARPVLSRLRQADPDAAVRREAAVSALALGEAEAREQVLAVVQASDVPVEVRRRAALVLGAAGHPGASPELLAVASDEEADLDVRARAITLLGALRSREAARPLLALLAHPTLRPAAASALGRIGDRSVAPALRTALGGERYPAARTAMVGALSALRDRAAAEVIRSALLASEPATNAVLALAELGALRRPGWGADIRVVNVRQALPWPMVGTWSCRGGCRPDPGASLVLRSCAGSARWRIALAHDAATGVRLAGGGAGAGPEVVGQAERGAVQRWVDVPCEDGRALARVSGTGRVLAVAVGALSP